MQLEADGTNEETEAAEPPAPVSFSRAGDPCHICGGSLFILAERTGHVCGICDSRIYRGGPMARLPAARGAGGYARTGEIVPASPAPRQN